jgi:hypothetical protein
VKIPDYVTLSKSGRVFLEKPKYSAKQSWTWEYFRKVRGKEGQVFCMRCYEKEDAAAESADRDMDESMFIFIAANGSSGALESHMKRHHNDVFSERIAKQAAQHIGSSGTIEAFCNLTTKFEEKALLWTVMTYQPFSTFDDEFFRAMCEALSSKTRHISGERMRGNVTRAAAFVRQHFADILAGQTPSFTIDKWTSPANVAYLGVTVHFIDETFTLQHLTIWCGPTESERSRQEEILADFLNAVESVAKIPEAAIFAVVSDTEATT